jgi:hypothetical protein
MEPTRDLPLDQYVHQLFVPLGLTLLGLSSWLLARPRLHIRPDALPVPRLLSGLIAFFGVVCAVFACAELASAFADAGLVVLLDASLMFVALSLQMPPNLTLLDGCRLPLGSRG